MTPIGEILQARFRLERENLGPTQWAGWFWRAQMGNSLEPLVDVFRGQGLPVQWFSPDMPFLNPDTLVRHGRVYFTNLRGWEMYQ